MEQQPAPPGIREQAMACMPSRLLDNDEDMGSFLILAVYAASLCAAGKPYQMVVEQMAALTEDLQ
jgi:hypothetical protein